MSFLERVLQKSTLLLVFKNHCCSLTSAGGGYKLSFHMIQAAKVFNPNDVLAFGCAGHVFQFGPIDAISNAKCNHLRLNMTRRNLF